MPDSCKLLLIRHGEIPIRWKGRYVGRTDPGLSTKGREQAAVLAAELAQWNPQLIYASPLRRAMWTARAAAPGREILTDDRLREIDFGDWDGLTFDEIAQLASPEQIRVWTEEPDRMTFPGGESMPEFAARVDAFFAELAAAASAQTPASTSVSAPAPTSAPTPTPTCVAVVTHGGVLMHILCKIRRISPARRWEVLPPRGSLQVVDFPFAQTKNQGDSDAL